MAQPSKGVIGNILERPGAFAGVFVVMFVLTYAFLASVDALPEGSVLPDERNATPGAAVSEEGSMLPEEPVRVVAPSIKLDETVANPNSTDIAVLDAALLDGAVRYPTSAMLGQEGTVFLFGHSSYLPIVHNQAYKAFNRIQDLKTGEVISVYSGTTEYRYKVTGVRLADASEDVIELPQTGYHLTLVTCDSFGKKTSRFVVTADFAGTLPLTP